MNATRLLMIYVWENHIHMGTRLLAEDVSEIDLSKSEFSTVGEEVGEPVGEEVGEPVGEEVGGNV
jgi:hypothetical protein